LHDLQSDFAIVVFIHPKVCVLVIVKFYLDEVLEVVFCITSYPAKRLVVGREWPDKALDIVVAVSCDSDIVLLVHGVQGLL